jgi:riboflavin kinase/FMN adenylyltransferase
MEYLYTFLGRVEEGHKRGKRLGFPTINMQVASSIPEGIYVSQVRISGVFYKALTFVGAAKTYGETEVKAETYVFDFHDDIYGEEVNVMLLKKLRENEKFVSEEALIKQMEADKQAALDFFLSSQS